MVKSFMTQDDVIDELKERTGFYKKNIRDVLEALDDIILEHMNTATYDEPSEMRLFKGWRLGAKRIPARQSYDPRNRDEIVTPEKLKPYCQFKNSYKQRINKYDMDDNEGLNDEDEIEIDG